VTRSVEALFTPRSVAVVGASATRGTWGYQLAIGALAGRRHRRVHLVNPRRGELDGSPFAPSLASLDEPADLVVVAVPAAAFGSVVDDALATGARAVVGVTAGLPAPRVVETAARVRAAGALLLGPNCMGVFDAATSLRLLWGDLPAGDIALLTQSGNLALELGAIAGRGGLGCSRFASLGDAVDVTAAELLAACAEHDATRSVALYLESVGDGRAFLDAAASAIEVGKPVVLLAAGRSPVGARAARSHTGALASDHAVLASACRDAGIILVDSPTALVEATRVAVLRRRPGLRATGRRLGIVADGGGHGVVAADLAVAAGLDVVAFSAALSSRLAADLPATAATANPVDLAGAGERDLFSYGRVVAAVAGSGEVDAVLLSGYFGAYGVDEPSQAATEATVADAIAAAPVPVFVHSMAPDSATSHRLAGAGAPVWRAVEHALAAVPAALTTPTPVPPALGGGPPVGADLRGALECAGVRFARARRVTTLAQARQAAAELTYPVVLKSTGLAHKSDVGGVALDLTDEEALNRAWEAMAARLASPAYTVEEMVATRDGVEMIVGARRDPSFGPVVLVGVGGVLAELLADTAVALAPTDRAGALRLVAGLRGASLLHGHRGRPRVDTGALADVVAAVSRVAAGRPDVAELDLNPVLVTADGAIALDLHVAEAAL
jgi:acyl-CoA synthetase (NDP forming)